MKDKPHDRPSGGHPFDRVCAKAGVAHRLIAHRLFASHADRDAFLLGFVRDYNRTRLKCLGYLAPLQALANPPEPNTCAGMNG
jgi:hypothetical protein